MTDKKPGKQPERPKELMDLNDVVGDADVRDADAPRRDQRMSLSEFSADRKDVEKGRGGIAGVEASDESIRRRQAVHYGLVASIAAGVILILAVVWYFLPEDKTGNRIEQANAELAAIQEATEGLKLPPLRKSMGTRTVQVRELLRVIANASDAPAMLVSPGGSLVMVEPDTAVVAEWSHRDRKRRRVILRPDLTRVKAPLARLTWNAKKSSILVTDVHGSKAAPVSVGSEDITDPDQKAELKFDEHIKIGKRSWRMRNPADSIPTDFPANLRDPWDRLYNVEVSEDDDGTILKVRLRCRGPKADDRDDDITIQFKMKP